MNNPLKASKAKVKLNESLSYLLLLMLLAVFVGCEQVHPSSSAYTWQEIAGRDEFPLNNTIIRRPVYRAKVPLTWTRQDPKAHESNFDTTKPLCEFRIEDQEGSVRIAVHNFPSDSAEQRIPPGAQVSRWKNQLEPLDPASIVLTPQAYGGFSGLMFQGRGYIRQQETAVIGWSMQLGLDQYRALQLQGTAEEKRYFKQMRSDYTIKATGLPRLIDKYQAEIIEFGRSFELIQEIPIRS